MRNRIIRRIAKLHGISYSQCRADIMAAISAAWATTDPDTKLRQVMLIGEDRVPTPEEFFLLISQKVLDKSK